MFDACLSFLLRSAALVVSAGWLLSALGALTLTGYGIAVGLALAALWLGGQKFPPLIFRNSFRRPLNWWRRRRVLPLLFLVISALIGLGSVLHAPNNFDGLSYRAPRVLNWLAAHHWHWITTALEPTNYMMANYEWLTAPLLAATHNLHYTVVINWISFAVLPPLFFSLLRNFGVPRRVAYDWMWVFPSGCLIALLAGGIGNDLLGLAMILAGLHFARRFTERGSNHFLFDALLAAGFATGVKLTNVPLALFVAIVLLQNVRKFLAHARIAVAGCLLAALVSGLIPLVLNYRQTGSVLGTTSGVDQTTHPVAGWLGNGLIVAVGALAPPVFPGARQASALAERALPENLAAWLHRHYPKFNLSANELPQEEGGALGLGLTLVCAVMLWVWWRSRHQVNIATGLNVWQRRAWWAWLIFALAVLCAKLGTGPPAPRNLLPWFALALAPGIGFFSRARLASVRLWRSVTVLAMLSVLPALLLTPSRPLIPPACIQRAAQMAGASAAVQSRLASVYGSYALRADPFAEIRGLLPAASTPLGLVSSGEEPVAAWWKPYGQRRCEFLLSAADVAAARQRGVQYVVIEREACEKFFGSDVPGWLAQNQAQAIQTFEVIIFASRPPKQFTLAHLATP